MRLQSRVTLTFECTCTSRARRALVANGDTEKCTSCFIKPAGTAGVKLVQAIKVEVHIPMHLYETANSDILIEGSS